MNDAAPVQPSAPTEPVGIGETIRNQRRALLLAVGLVVAAIWISIPMGEWRFGVFLAIGFVLGFVNHLLTEHVLRRVIAAGDETTRQAYAAGSLVRLLGISAVAVVVTVVFWPDGAAVLFGLAIFHLIALVLTAFPLLREVRNLP